MFTYIGRTIYKTMLSTKCSTDVAANLQHITVKERTTTNDCRPFNHKKTG